MDCMEFNRMLDDYVNLDTHDKFLMNVHAESCENCRRELEFYHSVMQTAASLPVIEPPADLLDKINSRIDSMPKRMTRFDKAVNNFSIYRMQYATAAACLAVGLIVGLNSGVIQDKLNPPAADGVISTSKRVSDKKDGRLNDYELDDSDDEDESKQNSEDRVVAERDGANETEKPGVNPTSAPTAKSSSSLPAATGRPAASSKTSAAAGRTAPQQESRTASAATAASGSSASAYKPVSVPRVTAAPVITSVPATEAPVITDEPVRTDTADTQTEQSSKSRYTIARGNYYIPETAEANIETTEEPTAAINTDIEGERYQIAMGSYEISDVEKKALAQNKLIVNESDISKIIECMNSSWINGTTEGYTATATAFANFLAKLDAEGIYYNYIQLAETGSDVYFVLLAN